MIDDLGRRGLARPRSMPVPRPRRGSARARLGVAAARDRADVRGRLRVESPSRIAAIPRAAAAIALRPVSGLDPGMGRATMKLGEDPEVRRRRGDDLPDRGGMIEHISEPARRTVRSNALAPWSAILLADGEQQLEPDPGSIRRSRQAPCELEHDGHRGLVVAPTIPSFAFSHPRSTTTGSTGAANGTVSRWAQSKIVSGPLPGIRASRFPAPAPTRRPHRPPRRRSPSHRAHGSPSRRTRARGGTGLDRARAANSRPAAGALPPPARLTTRRRARPCAEKWTPAQSPRPRRVEEAGGRRPNTFTVLARANAAPTRASNSGAGRSGRDLNSGWTARPGKTGARPQARTPPPAARLERCPSR